jgi:hypothetical protein
MEAGWLRGFEPQIFGADVGGFDGPAVTTLMTLGW